QVTWADSNDETCSFRVLDSLGRNVRFSRDGPIQTGTSGNGMRYVKFGVKVKTPISWIRLNSWLLGSTISERTFASSPEEGLMQRYQESLQPLRNAIQALK